jgi:arylsulfatase A-like enzyme
MERNDKGKQGVLYEIKAGALLLQHNMSSHLLGEALYAQMEYDQLVEQFHAGNREWCSDEDYETARRDFDAFIRLLDAAIGRVRQELGEGASEKS